MTSAADGGYRFEPIGFVRSPFTERVQAPRQAPLAAGVEGRIELLPGRGYDHALEGLGEWDYVWVVFVFHRNVEQSRGWKAKVTPPRAPGGRKLGVFATRSPHRPNAIGLTAARIVAVEGLVVHVRGLDLLDGTPVLDLKPYVAYADAFPTAGSGWLEARDPLPAWRVVLSDGARAQIAWLAQQGVDLAGPIETALSLGPTPRPYRRIRVRGEGFELAVKDWRVDFAVDGEGGSRSEKASPEGAAIRVVGVRSGYRPAHQGGGGPPALHRDFTQLFRSPKG